MLRSRIDPKDIGDLAQSMEQSVRQAEGICHLGSSCPRRKDTSDGEETDELYQPKGSQGSGPLPGFSALFKKQGCQ